MSRGRFITLEGGDGCGKTTQGHLLAQALRLEGVTVERTREPGGTQLGNSIREWLLAPGRKGLDHKTELLLFSAARSELIAKVIKPFLDDGVWVISDRFYDSTVVYQAMVRGVEREFVTRTNKFVVDIYEPDITFVLDVPAGISLERASHKQELWDRAPIGMDPVKDSQLEFWEAARDRIERETLEFHEKVRAGYLELANLYPHRVKVIDGTANIKTVHQECWDWVRRRRRDWAVEEGMK